MYLAVEDSIGHTAVVYHDDPNAVLIDNWTEWNIDLKDFADQGMNLADVNRIAIGVGDRYNPIPGGSGTIYFDDIRLCRPGDVAGEGTPFAADCNSDSVVDMADLWVMAEEWLTLRQ